MNIGYESCTVFCVDIYESVRNARVLALATGRETSYQHILFIRDLNTL